LGGALSLLFYLIGLTAIAKQENLLSVRSLWALGFLSVPFIYAIATPFTGLVGFVAYAALAACVVEAIRLLRGDRKDRIPRAVVTLIAGISLLDAVLIAGSGAPSAAALAMLGFPATMAMQRLVRGT
jgi:4-hydroxybenzoate polyprenyltransferase